MRFKTLRRVHVAISLCVWKGRLQVSGYNFDTKLIRVSFSFPYFGFFSPGVVLHSATYLCQMSSSSSYNKPKHPEHNFLLFFFYRNCAWRINSFCFWSRIGFSVVKFFTTTQVSYYQSRVTFTLYALCQITSHSCVILPVMCQIPRYVEIPVMCHMPCRLQCQITSHVITKYVSKLPVMCHITTNVSNYQV